MTVYAPFLVYAKGTVPIDVTIKRNGAIVDLSGKTVTATTRLVNNWETILDGSLEDQGVIIVTAASGLVQVQLDGTKLVGNQRSAIKGNPHGIQFFVTEDNYYPELLIIGVRDAN